MDYVVTLTDGVCWFVPALLVIYLSAFPTYALLPSFDWVPELRLADIIPGHDPPGISSADCRVYSAGANDTPPSTARPRSVVRVDRNVPSGLTAPRVSFLYTGNPLILYPNKITPRLFP